MEIKNGSHKALLYNLFSNDTPQGPQLKQFPLEELEVAMSCAKKLMDGSKEVEVEGRANVRFADKKMKFTPEEWVFLKKLFEGKQTGTIVEAGVMAELKELFEKADKDK